MPVKTYERNAVRPKLMLQSVSFFEDPDLSPPSIEEQKRNGITRLKLKYRSGKEKLIEYLKSKKTH